MRIENFSIYSDRDDVTLTAYLLDESTDISYSKKRPGIIINPGGAYVLLSDREAEPIAMRFAGLGYQTFLLRYSVINGKENVWPADISHLPERRPEGEYPAPLLELGKAMLLVREHAKEWNVDCDQIGVCGFSAGGHNAAMYASCWHRPVLTEALHVSGQELKPSFCIAGYPFIDWELEYNLERVPELRQAYKWMYFDYFGETDPTVEKMRECSVNHLVSEKTVPTFIWTTSTDQSLHPLHSIFLAMEMAKKNIPYELHIFGEGQHGLALADRATLNQPEDINDTVAQWFPLAETWLKRIVTFGEYDHVK